MRRLFIVALSWFGFLPWLGLLLGFCFLAGLVALLFSFALLVLLLRLVLSGLLLRTFAASGLLFSFGGFFALRGIALLRL